MSLGAELAVDYWFEVVEGFLSIDDEFTILEMLQAWISEWLDDEDYVTACIVLGKFSMLYPALLEVVSNFEWYVFLGRHQTYIIMFMNYKIDNYF